MTRTGTLGFFVGNVREILFSSLVEFKIFAIQTRAHSLKMAPESAPFEYVGPARVSPHTNENLASCRHTMTSSNPTPTLPCP